MIKGYEVKRCYSFTLPDNLADLLEQLANDKGLSKAALVKIALSEYFKKEGVKADNDKQ